MQTRFQCGDYFVSSPIEALETLAFFQFPVPQVSPSPPISTFSHLLLFFDSVVDVSIGIEKLPIESTLSKFFSEILPQNIEIDVLDFDADGTSASRENACFRSLETQISKESDVLNEEKRENQSTCGSETVDIEVSKKINGRTVDEKCAQLYEVTQFETPELDLFLENASFFENEGVRILSEVREIENNSDMLKPGIATNYPYEVLKSVLSVEDITFEYQLEQKVHLLQGDSSLHDQILFNKITFPLLEVDEIVMENISSFPTEDILVSLFENTEVQYCQKDDLDINEKELFGSKCDIVELLSDPSLLSPRLGSVGSVLESLGNFQEIDLISMVEISQIKMKSAFEGAPDYSCFLSDGLVVFQEFQLLDVDSSQCFEVFFNEQTTYELETCDWMFNEPLNNESFNNLIVSHELTLVDDTFKSFPVPVLSDHEKLKSFYVIIEEKIADLKPQPLSALDGIYLDWHLLEEDKYSGNTYSDSENMLEDIGLQRVTFDWDFVGDRNLVYDFIFSDICANGLNIDENGESKEFLSDSAILTNIPVEVELAPNNAERASLLFKTMSESSDLNYFLDTQKATTQRNSESVVRAVNNNGTSPNVSPSNSDATVYQAGIGESNTMSALDENVNWEKLFNCSPVEEKCSNRFKEPTDTLQVHSKPLPMPSFLFAKESNHIDHSMVSFPERLIIVNTQNLDKEMIISRRSTYQRMLGMEKEGTQVVERDLDIPVDVIISSATCLIWYDCRNIGKKATALDEASSCLPLCIENIATNVLTLLSFSFSSCILVFEGENIFLSTVMESSDGLYAAAASLGIDVQLFCSDSSELTDEIILSCIRYAPRGVYPRMPESETLAESLLTKFSSINPLTAHAILSSGGMLNEFLEWSRECRKSAIQKYNVPDESITLFGVLCKFGELEDSRSILTDCSSSVSSGTDSVRFNLNAASKRKRWKYDGDLEKSDMCMVDSVQFDPVNQFSKDYLDPSVVPKQRELFTSREPETSHEFRKPRSYENILFGHEQVPEKAAMMNPSTVPKPDDFPMSKRPQIFNEVRNPGLSLNDMLCQKQGTDAAMLKHFGLHDINHSETLHEDQTGKVIDLEGCPGLGEEFYSIANSISSLIPEIEKDATRNSKTAKRLSFDNSRWPTFPISSKIDLGSNIWNSVNDKKNSAQVGANRCSNADLGGDFLPINHHSKLFDDGFKHRYARNSKELHFQEESSNYGGTPLSNAVNFASQQQKTPWTMEFLNRIREKSRLHQQSVPCDTSIPCFGGSGNISKVTKRRSPSILEFFKYQGGSTKRKVPEAKKQKQSAQSSSSSKDERTSASNLATMTPADKRARKTLSFAINDSGRQTKLVWNDEAQSLRKKFQRQI
ncbi:hypothetical protein UlMin_044760 [Ulmus minor]